MAVGIVATLAMVLTAGMNKVVFSARKTDSVAVLRGYGGAILAYAADNQELPGPLYQGQVPVFTGSRNYLSAHIWPYFEKEAPKEGDMLPWLVTKHFKAWYLKQSLGSKKAAYMLGGDTKTPSGESLRPFGYQSDAPEARIEKANWIKFSSGVSLGTAVVMYEAFATSSAPTRSPKKGEIQNYKATLYFDGHVGIDGI